MRRPMRGGNFRPAEAMERVARRTRGHPAALAHLGAARASLPQRPLQTHCCQPDSARGPGIGIVRALSVADRWSK